MLFVLHLLQALLYAEEFHADVHGGYAHYGANLLVTHVLQPKQYDGTVNEPQGVDALVQSLHLEDVVVVISV